MPPTSSALPRIHGKKYYPAIDGLRAIAVLAVILFHLHVQAFSGGFVGVDVFFVISGYLITRNIVNDIEHKRFSFLRFYLARVRRLFPAMLATIILTFIAGALLFSPDAFSRLAGSSIAATVSMANIRYWMTSGYFDTASGLKPLLHFWSLSVEEQFYLFWPALLALLFLGSNRGRLAFVIPLLGILSLMLSEWQLATDPSFSFYWMPTRIYEFALGVFVIWLERRPLSNSIMQALFVLGLGLILVSVIFFTEDTAFPGVSAIVPCVGAMLLLWTKDTPLALSLLANAAASHVGRISYSLYLVHWPILVFYSFWTFRPVSAEESIVLLLGIFIVAHLLYYQVEVRFRFHPTTSKNTSTIYYSTAAFVALVVILASLQVRHDKGYPQRSMASGVPYISPARCERSANGSRECHYGVRGNGRRNILLIGDSHSISQAPVLAQFAKERDFTFESISIAGCPPIMDVRVQRSPGKIVTDAHFTVVCREEMPRALSKAASGLYDVVIITARWMWYLESSEYSATEPVEVRYLTDSSSSAASQQDSRRVWMLHLKETIDSIVASGAGVIVFSQAPLMGSQFIGECNKSPTLLIPPDQHQSRCDPLVNYVAAMDRLAFTNQFISGLADERVMVVRPSDYLCKKESGRCDSFSGDLLYYHDRDHLSVEGNLAVLGAVGEQLASFINHPRSQQ